MGARVVAGGERAVHGGLAATGGGVVIDVVMDQRECMDHLQRRRGPGNGGPVALPARGVPALDTQQRSDPIATREHEATQLLHHLAGQLVLGRVMGLGVKEHAQVLVDLAPDASSVERVGAK